MDYRIYIIVLIFIVIDILTGVVKALKTGTFQSSVMREGLWHKLGEIFSIVVGYLCEIEFPYLGIDVNVPIVKGLCAYLCLMELASIIENIGTITPAMQSLLNQVFGKFNEKDE